MLNWPTRITVARILLTVVIMTLLFVPGLSAKSWCLALFLLASLTDWLDGHLARRLNQVTPLGVLLDPIADKVLVLGLFISFVQLRLAPAWMVLLIIARELLITGVRLYAASRRVVISAALEGKHKTVSQMVAIVVILSALIVRETPAVASTGVATWLPRLILGGLWIAVILTVVSGASFFWRHRAVWRHGSAH